MSPSRRATVPARTTREVETEQEPGESTWFSRRRPAARLVDVLAMCALLLLALMGLQPLFGGWRFLLTGAVALLLTLVIALIGARWSWGPTRTFLCLLVIYAVLGTPFAVPETALWGGVVPSLDSLWALLTAPIDVWRTALTMAPPVGTVDGVLAVVWIIMLILPQLAFAVLLRTRHYLLAWLFPFALLAITIALGTTVAAHPLARGIAFALISLAWISWRHESSSLARGTSTLITGTEAPASLRNPVLRRRIAGAALVLAIAGGAAAWALPQLTPPPGTARSALRDGVVPPPELHDYVSPLAQYRGYVGERRDAEILKIQGAAPGDQVRLATMDDYDRQVFKVAGGDDKTSASGAFLRTAADVLIDTGSSSTRQVQVSIGDYTGPWMPTLGDRLVRITPEGSSASRLNANLYLNSATQTLLEPTGMRTGDTYALTYEPYRAPTPAEQSSLRFGDIDLPSLPSLDPTVRSTAEELLGQDRSDYVRMQRLVDAIARRAVLSDGQEGQPPSLPGHGERRLLSMLADFDLDRDDLSTPSTSLVGDDEQLAALVAVLARSAGVPARVAVGFTVPESSDREVSVTGKDATAWVEVWFEGRGWVRFDPSPDAGAGAVLPGAALDPRTMPAQGTAPAQAVAPDVQPPPLPARRILPEIRGPEDAWRLIGLWIGIPAGVLLLAMIAVVITKAARRRRRREKGSAAARMNGGWLEVLDHARDLGVRLPRIDTREQTAARIAGRFPGVDALLVARWADRGVFGPEDLPPGVVYDFWREVMRTRRSMSAAVPWHRRLRAVFSTRSLRRPARPLEGDGR